MSMPTVENGYGNLDLSPYKVYSRREIVAFLRAISEQKQLLRLLMEGSGEATVTSILDVDEETDSVIIDIAPDNNVNTRLTQSDNVSFETVLDRIRIVFFATAVEPCLHADLPALRIAIPASLI
ncbi:MAG: flagellar brake protein, partial [Pseudomonadota bacterium]|nr:flagellar brake protein [Pseudomonadota bacterium]